MRLLSRISWHTFLLTLIIFNYMGVCIGSSLSHNHKPSTTFHDDCPACQWEIQSQEDFFEVTDILDKLANPLNMIGYGPAISIHFVSPQEFVCDHFSRAPPSNK